MSRLAIAQRQLTCGMSPVDVTVFAPYPDRGDFRCEYEIVGLASPIRDYTYGLDGVQALLLAMKMIGAHLYTSDEFKADRLRWVGNANLGFPVPDVLSDLVPP